ncbi:MAG: M28 family peptidase [Sphingomonadales bacterium]|nr:M28 family peptidase [Sphingomonadales bacterium]
MIWGSKGRAILSLRFRGSNASLPPVVIACHLDSWDLGTGAIDDASGCGIVTAAASYLKKGPPLNALSACYGRRGRSRHLGRQGLW